MLVYPDSAPEKLGFQIILDDVASHLVSQPGVEALERLRPSSVEQEVRGRFARVAEVRDAFEFDDPLGWSDLPDVRHLVKNLRPAGSLADGPDLLELNAVLAAADRLRAYFSTRNDRYPAVGALLAPLAGFGEVVDVIAEAIGKDGAVLDSASPDLGRVRRSIVTRERDLRKSLDAELRSAVSSGFATDDQPTIRNGRMVIPIRAEAKRKVRGFVQDASATGQTVFVEPASCLELNNELRELQAAEGREVRRILLSIADTIRSRLDDLVDAIDILARFDVVQAKARTALRLHGVVPGLNSGTRLNIVEGRNPALALRFCDTENSQESRNVVPLTLELDAGARTLLITGPNAGGKTVALATVGLFALMVAHGIPIPADESTDLPLFRSILVDIGDEQSIEHDLSTFSSHLKNVARMAADADDGTLALIDEAGTGTDPEEGAALAQAALESLAEAGAWTLATTHHGRLKAFAHENAVVRNGAMEFDRESLAPTYRFRIDVPGSSYAFEIGRRMGLPSGLLDRARELVGESKAALEDLIADYEARVTELTSMTASLDREREELRRIREEYESGLGKLRDERARSRDDALRSADRLLRKANVEIERTIREIKEAQAERRATRTARERLEGFRAAVESEIERGQPAGGPPPGQAPASEIGVGDQVVLDDGSVRAEVAEIDDAHAVIVNKAVRLRVRLDRLTRVGGPEPRRAEVRRQTVGGTAAAIEGVRQRIDLRGQRVDEALREVDRMLDAALPSGLERLEILHGKGTGALREAIWELLAGRPEVAAFEEAPVEQGGAGVTVVHLQ